MKAKKFGRIVNIGSINGQAGAVPPDLLEKIIAKIPAVGSARHRTSPAAWSSSPPTRRISSPARRSRSVAASICTDGDAAALLAIRSVAAADYDALLSILEPVLRAGEAYSLPRRMRRDEAIA
jgi:hypothetical protein